MKTLLVLTTGVLLALKIGGVLEIPWAIVAAPYAVLLLIEHMYRPTKIKPRYKPGRW